jgi:hypothetical protein
MVRLIRLPQEPSTKSQQGWQMLSFFRVAQVIAFPAFNRVTRNGLNFPRAQFVTDQTRGHQSHTQFRNDSFNHLPKINDLRTYSAKTKEKYAF